MFYERGGYIGLRRSFWLCLSLFLTLTACGLPQPFVSSDSSRASNTRLDLGARAQLLVTPVVGVPGANGSRLFTDVLIGALRDRDIPAFGRAQDKQMPLLAGQVQEAPGEGSTFIVTFSWSLISPTSGVSKSFKTFHTIEGLDWLQRDPEAMASLSREVAASIDAQLAPQSLAADLSGVYLHPLDGLSGDGNQSLYTALRHELEKQAVAVVTERGLAAVEIKFTGSVVPLPNGADLVSLLWEVYHVGGDQDGVRIGQIDLANPVPDGLADGGWGNLATAAAQGSAEGIFQLLIDANIL